MTCLTPGLSDQQEPCSQVQPMLMARPDPGGSLEERRSVMCSSGSCITKDIKTWKAVRGRVARTVRDVENSRSKLQDLREAGP